MQGPSESLGDLTVIVTSNWKYFWAKPDHTVVDSDLFFSTMSRLKYRNSKNSLTNENDSNFPAWLKVNNKLRFEFLRLSSYHRLEIIFVFLYKATLAFTIYWSDPGSAELCFISSLLLGNIIICQINDWLDITQTGVNLSLVQSDFIKKQNKKMWNIEGRPGQVNIKIDN